MRSSARLTWEVIAAVGGEVLGTAAVIASQRVAPGMHARDRLREAIHCSDKKKDAVASLLAMTKPTKIWVKK